MPVVLVVVALLCGVEISAAFGERPGRIGRAVACGVHQRGPLPFRQRGQHAFEAERILGEFHRVRARVDVGALRQQEPDRFGVVFGSRPHQCLFAKHLLAGVDVGPAIEQRLHRRRIPGSRRRHQRRLPS